ncbi:unannotated protein [freshwater metagenome]|uniref:Unannotated protein n=1 Tax=freshwater metagenome TaxID=449393 RepID=A0A6J6BJ86_9ZZZZ
MPTASRINSAQARSTSVAAEPPLIAAAPSPTNAGVFGIARITATCGPMAASRVAMLIPAAMDNTRFTPRLRSEVNASTT